MLQCHCVFFEATSYRFFLQIVLFFQVWKPYQFVKVSLVFYHVRVVHFKRRENSQSIELFIDSAVDNKTVHFGQIYSFLIASLQRSRVSLSFHGVQLRDFILDLGSPF